MIRVLIAEDHETVRDGLRLLINAQADMTVVGEAADGRAAIERAEVLVPDVAVIDISMPDVNGLVAARTIADRVPHTAVVALTRYADGAYVRELLRSGVRGYVLKQSASSELLEAIRAAAAGRQYLDAKVAVAVSAGALSRHRQSPAARITPRESEVLQLTALGHSNKEIGTALDVSVKTVEVHKANAMRKLGLQGRIDVVRYAILQGWLTDK